MKFKVVPSSSRAPVGNLVYRADDYAFDYEPVPPGFTSMLINTLSLEVNRDGLIVSVWGMCPHTSWKLTPLKPPAADSGGVIVGSDRPFHRGVSLQVNENGPWPVYADVESGWVQVASGRAAKRAVNVLPGVILEITGQDDIAALWLKPINLPKLMPPMLNPIG